MEEENHKCVVELLAEKAKLDPSLSHCSLLLAQEIDRYQTGTSKDKMIEVHVDKPTQISTKIRIPIKEYPKVSFVGRLLGQKGSNMKRLQEETGAKICIQGRGSMRDPDKEENLRKEGGRYAHLSEELHVYIETYGNPVECHQKMALAIQEVSKYLSPDYADEASASQYPVDGVELPGLGRGIVPPPTPAFAPMVRGRAPDAIPAYPPVPPPLPMRPSFGAPFPPPGIYGPPAHVRRPRPPPPPVGLGLRSGALRPRTPSVPVATAPGQNGPMVRPYAVPPKRFVPPVPPVSTHPTAYDYGEYESTEYNSAASEDFTADDWAKDITTTNGNFRGKMPAARLLKKYPPTRFVGHPYAPRGAKR